MAVLDFVGWILLWVLPIVGIGLALVYIASLAFETRRAREERARNPPPIPHDYAAELRSVNAEVTSALAEGRASLEQARETLRRGIKG